MINIKTLTAAAFICAAPTVFAQAPPAAPFPKLAGVWAPSDPKRSDTLFGVGLTNIPGTGRLTIDQRPGRLSVAISMPDDQLDVILRLSNRFVTAIMYSFSETRWIPVGFGAGGPQLPTTPTWIADTLVIPDAEPGAKGPIKRSFSLDGGRLKVETTGTPNSAGRVNTVTEFFTRIK